MVNVSEEGEKLGSRTCMDSKDAHILVIKNEALLRWLLFGHLVVCIDICSFPWVADPYISNSPSCAVSVLVDQIFGKLALLLLVLVL